mmetsp:Transcript_71280/g.186897  ORF Transcript_71280/g.186897 Transcript_71280/m.186897 type:complete len:293 (-) Transcript_71280:38-916(-)
MCRHGRLEFHPVARVQLGHLFVVVLAEEQRDVRDVAARVARRVHRHHDHALRAHEEHVEALADHLHLPLPLEAPLSVPLLEVVGRRGPVPQRSPRPAVEHEVLPREHGGRPLVDLVGGVEVHRRAQHVHPEDCQDEKDQDHDVLPRQYHGAVSDLERHDLGAESGEIDAGLPRNDVEAARAVVHDVLERGPQERQDPEGHPAQAEPHYEAEDPGHPRGLVVDERHYRAVAVWARAVLRHVAEGLPLVGVLLNMALELDELAQCLASQLRDGRARRCRDHLELSHRLLGLRLG